jgi:hypothetical protein
MLFKYYTLFLFISLSTFAQLGPRQWQDHTGFSNCNTLTRFGNDIVASNRNGLVKIDQTEYIYKRLNKIIGFEQFTTINGYKNPTNRNSLNKSTKSNSVATCGKLNPSNPVSNYLVVKILSITGKGLILGRVVSDKINTVSYKTVLGFPFASKPLNLSYNMQYMVALPSDTTFLSVFLTKWNVNLLRHNIIAFGISNFNAMDYTWFTNSTNLNNKSGNNSYSDGIAISSSNNAPINNSYMNLDNLLFNGSVIGIDKKNVTAKNVTLYPNPSKEIVTINISQPIIFPIQINNYDNAVKLVFAKNNKKNKTVIDVPKWTEST